MLGVGEGLSRRSAETAAAAQAIERLRATAAPAGDGTEHD
jgi:dsRNA-specific ribonuclease